MSTDRLEDMTTEDVPEVLELVVSCFYDLDMALQRFEANQQENHSSLQMVLLANVASLSKQVQHMQRMLLVSILVAAVAVLSRFVSPWWLGLHHRDIARMHAHPSSANFPCSFGVGAFPVSSCLCIPESASGLSKGT